MCEHLRATGKQRHLGLGELECPPLLSHHHWPEGTWISSSGSHQREQLPLLGSNASQRILEKSRGPGGESQDNFPRKRAESERLEITPNPFPSQGCKNPSRRGSHWVHTWDVCGHTESARTWRCRKASYPHKALIKLPVCVLGRKVGREEETQ